MASTQSYSASFSTGRAAYIQSELPWSSSKLENTRFLKIALLVLAITLLFAFFVAIRDVPEIPREQQEKLPPQLAKIIEAKTPPPPPVPIEPESAPEPEIVEPVEELIEPPEPIEQVVEEVAPPPEQTPEVVSEEEKIVRARETAKSKGVLAFQDQLASMRDQANLQNLANTNLSQGAGQAEITQRDMITSQTVATSGGIQVGELSSDIGAAGELEGRRNTEFVAASEGEVALATKRIESENQVVGNRDLDQIRQTLDANKGAVYSLYRRALRADPTIEGKLTVRLIIEPDGSLSAVSLVDSELDAPELVERLLSRIRLINFGAQNVTQTELEYAFNFLPF